MTAEDELKDLSSLMAFVDLDDIAPNLEAVKTAVEYEIFKNFLIPGVIINYLGDHVQFKSTQSNELFDVPYEKIRLTPKLRPDAKFQQGDLVETYVWDSDHELYGWAASTIMSAVGSIYVVNLVDRNSIDIVHKDKVRAVTQPVHLRAVPKIYTNSLTI